MADKFMCMYFEMQDLNDKFVTESVKLNQTVTEMQAFQTDTATMIAEFRFRIATFEKQAAKIETNLQAEISCVCGGGYEGGVGWIGEQSEKFVNSVHDTINGLAGCFNKFHQNMEEINTALTTLEQKIAEAVTELKTDVELLANFCTEWNF